MAFERFTKFGRSHKPVISIRTNGQMGFSQGAVEKYNLCNYSHAVLFYDTQEAKIGICFTNDKTEDGAVNIRVRDNNTYIAIKPFLDFYDINYTDKTNRYSGTWGENHMLIIDLRSPLT